jgi:hypothetical protein
VPDAEELATQRWYAVVDDMTTNGWCVMNVPKTPMAADLATGEYQIARGLLEPDAHAIADQHNAGLSGQPWTRPERHRVRAEDALIFDQLGETIDRAQTLLEDAEATPTEDWVTEIRRQRAVLREVLAALNLLTEGAIRLRSQHSETVR